MFDVERKQYCTSATIVVKNNLHNVILQKKLNEKS